MIRSLCTHEEISESNILDVDTAFAQVRRDSVENKAAFISLSDGKKIETPAGMMNGSHVVYRLGIREESARSHDHLRSLLLASASARESMSFSHDDT